MRPEYHRPGAAAAKGDALKSQIITQTFLPLYVCWDFRTRVPFMYRLFQQREHFAHCAHHKTNNLSSLNTVGATESFSLRHIFGARSCGGSGAVLVLAAKIT